MLHFDAQLINSITVQTNPRPISIPAYTRGNSMDVVAVTFSAYMLVTSTTNITFSKTLLIWNGDKKLSSMHNMCCYFWKQIVKKFLMLCVGVWWENVWLMLKRTNTLIYLANYQKVLRQHSHKISYSNNSIAEINKISDKFYHKLERFLKCW